MRQHLEGWRYWALRKYRGKWALQGNHYPETWHSRSVTARCLSSLPGHHQNLTPAEDCECGIHAVFDREDLLDESLILHIRGPAVLGLIEPYGKTLVGERGFRARGATLKKLEVVTETIPTGAETLVEELKKKYQVIVEEIPISDVPLLVLPDRRVRVLEGDGGG